VNRTAKAGSLALGLIGLLIVVALAARGGHPSGSGHFVSRAVPATLQDSLVTLLAIAYVVAIVAVIVLFFRQRPLQAPRESRWLRNYITVLVVMLVATLLGSWAIRHGHFGRNGAKPVPVNGQARPTDRSTRLPPGATKPAHFQWPLALGLLGLVIVGGVFVYIRERRSLSPLRRGGGVEAELAQAVETTIDELRRERDARRAVIAAYANMERVLAAHGLARGSAEAPLEYLARVLRTLHVRKSAVESLTRLFEYAKFSRHDIDAAMKDEAIGALVAVRDDLLAEERAAA
jgi:multisubunit Na+/H+ antiporter MnhB subunit